MPRYFFHSVDGHTRLDPLGTDLPDELAAKHHATRLAASARRNDTNRGIVVVDESGTEVMRCIPEHSDKHQE